MLALYHERIPNAAGIYRITCTANNKIYIGSAVCLRRRRKEHFGELQKNKHSNVKLQRAWDKYGPDCFTFEVLELVLIPEMLTAREQYYFGKLKPFGENGFNFERIAGSPLGLKRSEETREKHRIISSKQTHSAETRKLLSDLRLERGTTPKQLEQLDSVRHLAVEARRRWIVIISPDGTEYVVHGIVKFCEEHNLQPSHLLNVARGKYKHHKRWTARFLN